MTSVVVNGDRSVALSGDRSRHRITVLRTRRDWSLLEKRRIVIEASIPGSNVSAVARRHGIAPPLLYRWRKELMPDQHTPAFMPVTIAAPAPTPIMETPQVSPLAVPPIAVTTIEVLLANGRAVRVTADVDTAVLVRIVAALETPQ